MAITQHSIKLHRTVATAQTQCEGAVSASQQCAQKMLNAVFSAPWTVNCRCTWKKNKTKQKNPKILTFRTLWTLLLVSDKATNPNETELWKTVIKNYNAAKRERERNLWIIIRNKPTHWCLLLIPSLLESDQIICHSHFPPDNRKLRNNRKLPAEPGNESKTHTSPLHSINWALIFLWEWSVSAVSSAESSSGILWQFPVSIIFVRCAFRIIRREPILLSAALNVFAYFLQDPNC